MSRRHENVWSSLDGNFLFGSRAVLPVAFADRVDGRSPAVESGEDVVDGPGVELSKQPLDVGYEFVVESP